MALLQMEHEDISTPSTGITAITAAKRDGIVTLAFSGASASASTHGVGTLPSGLRPKVRTFAIMRLASPSDGKYNTALVTFETNGTISFSVFIPNNTTAPFWVDGTLYGSITYVAEDI